MLESLTGSLLWRDFIHALWMVGAFAVAIMLLVAVHEYGHFRMARALGVRVLRFSIGFGRTLLRWTDRRGTEYVIAAVPLGGYVKMLDEREGEVAEADLPFSFNRQPIWKRSLIVAAGPLINLLFAVVLFWGLFAGGEDVLVPAVDQVAAGSIAAQAGVVSGQEIVAVDGEPVDSRQAVVEALLGRIGDSGELTLSVRYQGDARVYVLHGELQRWLAGEASPDPVRGLGLSFYWPPYIRLGDVMPNSAAERAGLRHGDIVEAVDGEPLLTAEFWLDKVQHSPGHALRLSVRRDGVLQEILVQPEARTERDGRVIGLLGVAFGRMPLPDTYVRHRDYGVFEAGQQAAVATARQIRLALVSIGKLVTGALSPKNLSGPLGIAKVAGDSARVSLSAFCQLLAVLSVSLGVMNLLPVPVLDGGHLLMYLVEAIKGSPVSDKLQVLGNQVGFALIISLMLFSLYNDLMKF